MSDSSVSRVSGVPAKASLRCRPPPDVRLGRPADQPQRAHHRGAVQLPVRLGDFLFALTLSTTTDVRPITLGLYQYLGTYVSDWSSVMATAVLASLPAIVLL